MRIFNTVICGVGGTGVIGLGMLLKELGMHHGYRVVGSETRGSSQRGGAITSSIRYIMGDSENENLQYAAYYPASIPVGKADVMISTETSEVLRQIIYLNENTKVLINKHSVVPKPNRKVIKKEGGIGYPDNDKISDDVLKIASFVQFVDASETSFKLFGTYTLTNYVLLGAAIQTTNLPIELDLVMNYLEDPQKKDAVLNGSELARKKKSWNQ